MEGVGVRPRRLVTQPVEDREPHAGWQPTTPYQYHRFQTQVPVAVNDEPDISIRKEVYHEVTPKADNAGASSPPSPCSSEDEMVVDMRPTAGVFQFNNVQLRQPGLSEKDLSIIVRTDQSRCTLADAYADLQVVEQLEELSEKVKGFVINGTEEDVHKLVDEKPSMKGVICFKEILHSENGFYEEGSQYDINGFQNRGAYGEAAMCRDRTTGKTFIRKKLQKQKLLKNEVKVPLMFRGNLGIPQMYGVIMRDEEAELFQEFAGLSLKKILEERDPNFQATVQRLRDPVTLLAVALQAFATLEKLHSQGITHQDIKPENICLDLQKNIQLKFIDFGSSQTPNEQIIEGLTNEYLSPESCDAILRVATKQLPLEKGRLGPGTDVWATALSLLYCLLGYHVMIYVCTGKVHYEETDPATLQQKRVDCLVKVRSLTDAEVEAKLIRREWPKELKCLLQNTLRVNPAQRWTAKNAYDYLTFIFNALKPRTASAQAPMKAQPVSGTMSEMNVTPRTASGFTGLSPARLVIRQQAEARQPIQAVGDRLPVQCTAPSDPLPPTPSTSTSPASPGSPGSPASTASTTSASDQLPAFNDLLSDDLSKKAPRAYKRKAVRETPYNQLPSRRGSKGMRT